MFAGLPDDLPTIAAETGHALHEFFAREETFFFTEFLKGVNTGIDAAGGEFAIVQDHADGDQGVERGIDRDTLHGIHTPAAPAGGDDAF